MEIYFIVFLFIRIALGNSETTTTIYETTPHDITVPDEDLNCFLNEIFYEKGIKDVTYAGIDNAQRYAPNKTYLTFNLRKNDLRTNCSMVVEDFDFKKKIISSCHDRNFPSLNIPVYLGSCYTNKSCSCKRYCRCFGQKRPPNEYCKDCPKLSDEVKCRCKREKPTWPVPNTFKPAPSPECVGNCPVGCAQNEKLPPGIPPCPQNPIHTLTEHNDFLQKFYNYKKFANKFMKYLRL